MSVQLELLELSQESNQVLLVQLSVVLLVHQLGFLSTNSSSRSSSKASLPQVLPPLTHEACLACHDLMFSWVPGEFLHLDDCSSRDY